MLLSGILRIGRVERFAVIIPVSILMGTFIATILAGTILEVVNLAGGVVVYNAGKFRIAVFTLTTLLKEAGDCVLLSRILRIGHAERVFVIPVDILMGTCIVTVQAKTIVVEIVDSSTV